MADGKKSFVLYVDLIHTVDKMPNEKAGELFKHILEYVNDNNPETDDLIVQLTFEPIKQQLKRDLKKWESLAERNKINGSKGGRPRTQTNPNKPTGFSGNPDKPKKPVSVNVNVSGNVNEIKKKEVFVFKNSLIDLGIEKQIVDDWLKVRKLKKATNTETAFNSIVKEINKSGLTPNDCIKKSVENSWSGFKTEWINNNKSFKEEHPAILREGKNYEQF